VTATAGLVEVDSAGYRAACPRRRRGCGFRGHERETAAIR